MTNEDPTRDRAEIEAEFRHAHAALLDGIERLASNLAQIEELRVELSEADPSHSWAMEYAGLPWTAVRQAQRLLSRWPAGLPEATVEEPKSSDHVLIEFLAPWGGYPIGSVAGFRPEKAEMLLATSSEIEDAHGNRKRVPLAQRLERDADGELVPAPSR